MLWNIQVVFIFSPAPVVPLLLCFALIDCCCKQERTIRSLHRRGSRYYAHESSTDHVARCLMDCVLIVCGEAMFGRFPWCSYCCPDHVTSCLSACHDTEFYISSDSFSLSYVLDEPNNTFVQTQARVSAIVLPVPAREFLRISIYRIQINRLPQICSSVNTKGALI